MTALAADRLVPPRLAFDAAGGVTITCDVVASDIIYKGAFVTEGTAGVKPAAQGNVPVLGIALEQVDNSSGSAGDKTVTIWMGGVIEHAVTGLSSIVQIGDPVFATDDQVLTMTAGTASYFGHVVGYKSGTTGWIKHSWCGEPES